MKIKIPKQIKIGVFDYGVVFVPHLCRDEGNRGKINHRKQRIEIEFDNPKSLLDVTFLHELVHQIEAVFGFDLPEEQSDHLAHGFAEFLFNNLDIEFDWSDIER